MSEVSEPDVRRDADAQRYQDHWQPVLDAAAGRLLERVAAESGDRLKAASSVGEGGPWAPDARAGAPPRTRAAAPGARGAAPRPLLLDVGAGTGAIALAAAERWSSAKVIGLDASAGMLSVARQRARLAGLADDADRLDWLVADAASIPLGDGSVDVAVSSFVLQLVGDRRAVIADIHRVLRPGGVFAFVTWLAEEIEMRADSEFDEAVYELELDDPGSVFREPKPGDFETLSEAEQELERAGFDRIEVRSDRLSYSWTREAYLEFKRSFDEHELFESLDAAVGDRLAQQVSQRWAALPDDAFTFTAPLVSALAYRRRT